MFNCVEPAVSHTPDPEFFFLPKAYKKQESSGTTNTVWVPLKGQLAVAGKGFSYAMLRAFCRVTKGPQVPR